MFLGIAKLTKVKPYDIIKKITGKVCLNREKKEMKMRKTVAVFLSVLCLTTAFASCGKEEKKPPAEVQTAADIALKKAGEQLANAKQAKLGFDMKLAGKNEEETEKVDLVDVNGDVTVYALENSLAWGAQVAYAGEETVDNLFASNSGVGRLNDSLGIYETLDMMPVTVNGFKKAFEQTAKGLFGSLMEEGDFWTEFADSFDEYAETESNVLTLSVELKNDGFFKDLLTEFASANATVTESELRATLLLSKGVGILDFKADGTFKAEITDKEANVFGRDIDFKDTLEGSISWDFSEFLETPVTDLPSVETIVYPLYSHSYTIAVGGATANGVEWSLKRNDDGDFSYVAEVSLENGDNTHVYTFTAPTQNTAPESLIMELESYTCNGNAFLSEQMKAEYANTTLEMSFSGSAIDFSSFTFKNLLTEYTQICVVEWTPIVSRSKAKVTSFTFEIKETENALLYVIELNMKWRDTKWTYVLEGNAVAGKATSVEFHIRDYARSDAEGTYDITDFETEERSGIVTFNWETKEANFKAFKMPSTWSGGY